MGLNVDINWLRMRSESHSSSSKLGMRYVSVTKWERIVQSETWHPSKWRITKVMVILPSFTTRLVPIQSLCCIPMYVHLTTSLCSPSIPYMDGHTHCIHYIRAYIQGWLESGWSLSLSLSWSLWFAVFGARNLKLKLIEANLADYASPSFSVWMSLLPSRDWWLQENWNIRQDFVSKPHFSNYPINSPWVYAEQQTNANARNRNSPFQKSSFFAWQEESISILDMNKTSLSYFSSCSDAHAFFTLVSDD